MSQQENAGSPWLKPIHGEQTPRPQPNSGQFQTFTLSVDEHHTTAQALADTEAQDVVATAADEEEEKHSIEKVDDIIKSLNLYSNTKAD